MVATGAPAAIIALVHVSAVVAHVYCNRILLAVLGFHFPITLAVVQYAGIALALGFWALFGLVRLRPLPLWSAGRLAGGAALCSALANLSLRHNSLGAFQAARLTAAPAIWVVECAFGSRPTPLRPLAVGAAAALVMVAAAGVAVFDAQTTLLGGIWAVAAVACTALYQVCSAHLRLTTKANELQLQLATKSLGTVMLMAIAPIFDDYAPSSDRSILFFEVDDTAALVLLLSAFLAFLSFVAQRASIARYSPRAYNALAYSVSVLIFAAHFFEAPSNARVQLPLVIAVLLSTLLFARTRDAYAATAPYTPLQQSSDNGPPPPPGAGVLSRPRISAPPALRALARAAHNPSAVARINPKGGRILNSRVDERRARPSLSEPDLQLGLQRNGESGAD